MTHKLTRTLALVAATGAAAAPVASAMPLPDDPPVGSAAYAPQPQPVKTVQSGGFDFGDAAIGAGATLGLLVLAGGGTFAMTRMRNGQVPAARA